MRRLFKQNKSNSVTSIDTITPISENVSPVSTLPTISEVGTTTITDSASTVTTILPIPTADIEIIPNPDLAINTVSGIVPNPDLLDIKQSLVDKKIYEINELYKEELFNNVITDADLSYIVKSFTVADLNSSDINNIIFTIMSCYNS